MIRAIDSRYFQLSISPESHETHARLFEACPYGFRCREPAGIPLRPLSRNRVSRIRTHVPSRESRGGTRKGRVPTLRIGSTLRRHGKREYRGPPARDRRSESDSARSARWYISRGNSCVYFLQNRKKREKEEEPEHSARFIRCVLASRRRAARVAGLAIARTRGTRRALHASRCRKGRNDRVGAYHSLYRPGIGILGNTEGHGITIRTHGITRRVPQRHERITETQRYVVPSSRRSLCTCLLPAWSYIRHNSQSRVAAFTYHTTHT